MAVEEKKKKSNNSSNNKPVNKAKDNGLENPANDFLNTSIDGDIQKIEEGTSSYLDELVEDNPIEELKVVDVDSKFEFDIDGELVSLGDDVDSVNEPILEFELMEELKNNNDPEDFQCDLFEMDTKMINKEYPQVDPATLNNAIRPIKEKTGGSQWFSKHKAIWICGIIGVFIIVLAYFGVQLLKDQFVDPNHEHMYVNHICKYCEKEETYQITYIDESGQHIETYSYLATKIVQPKLTQKEGYIASWGEMSLDDAGAKQIVAQYTVIDYTITYHIPIEGISNNIENVATYTVEDDIALFGLNENGYNFTGWYTDENLINYIDRINKGTTGNLNLYAKIAANQTAISFNLNGGSGSVNTVSVLAGDTYEFTDPAISKRAYKFVGWSTTKDGEIVYRVGDQFTAQNVNTKMTVYAVWDKNKTTITYNPNGGVGELVSQEFSCFTPTQLMTVPFSKNAATLIGWAKDPTGDIYLAADGTFTAGEEETSFTLYARWETNMNKIIFDRNGGEGTMDSFVIESLSSIILPECQYELLGSKFIGWSYQKDGTVAYEDLALYTASADDETITLYAIWAVSTEIIIHFNNNGGVGVHADEKCQIMNTVDLPTTGFTKTGLTFAGWALQSDGNVLYTDTYTYNKRILGGEITLYAIYDVNRTILIFDANTGSGEMEIQEIPAGYNAYISSNKFTKEGCKFIGWSYTADGNIDIYDGSIFKASTKLTTITLYAIWERNKTTIVYERNGASGAMKNQVIEAASVAYLTECKYTKENQYFVGWALTATGEPVYANNAHFQAGGESETVFLYAVFEMNKSVIHFDANGGEGTMADQSVYYLSPDYLNENTFTYANYRFLGWSTKKEPESLNNLFDDQELFTSENAYKEVTLYAIWEKNSVKVQFKNSNSSGEEVYFMKYSGDNYQLPKNMFERMGYSFNGWATIENGLKVYEDEEEIVIPSGISILYLYPLWTVNKTTIRFNGNGGTGYIAPIVLNSFESISLPECTFLKSNMHFIGWGIGLETMDIVNYVAGENYIAKSSNEELVCTAIWSNDIQTVKFYNNDGTNDYQTQDVNVYSGDKITVTPPELDKYKFLGWALKPDSAIVNYETDDFVILGILDDYSLYAVYETYKGTSGIIYNPIYDVMTIVAYELIEYVGTDKDVVIPGYYDSIPIIRIADEAFKDNTTIETVKIVTSVVEIGDRAFSGCTNLKSIDFGKKLETIGDSAFSLSGLQSVVLTENIATVKTGAFFNCVNISSITFNSKLTEIPELCFSGDISIKEVTIPGNIKKIGDSAFMGCTNLEYAHLEEGIEVIGVLGFATSGIKEVVCPDSLVKIDKYAFGMTPNLITVIFGTGLKNINAYAFTFTAVLEGIDIPANVNFIGESAFYLSALEYAIIRSELTYINMSAFSNCYNLKTVTLPSTLEFILQSAFEECSSLEEIHLPKTLKNVYEKAFDGSGLKKIYYDGETEQEWNAISMDASSIPSDLTIYYFHLADVTDEEPLHYWHYVGNEITIWK